MPQWLVLFIVADLVVMAVLVILIARGHLKLNLDFEVRRVGADFGSLLELTKEKHPRIGEYLRANWSGAPEQLPPILETLLGELECDARERGMTVDRDMLKTILAQMVRSHRIVRGRDLEQAMERVA